MNISYHAEVVKNPENFISLKKSAQMVKNASVKERIAKKPFATDFEYLLGAFIEMYEPHLKEIVRKLFNKGYAVDVSSGFGGKNAEFQMMAGDVTVDYVTRNKLEKIGVRFREYNGAKTLIFWPEQANLKSITAKWHEVIDTLPDKGRIKSPSLNPNSVLFRRKYASKDPHLHKQQLFEKLEFITRKKVRIETEKRRKGNSHPNPIEHKLGLFVEELEPQVRPAVVAMNKKGYSTDKSGFADNPCIQMIEGDFLLDGKTRKTLEKSGVQIETNPSGYTILQFSPKIANIASIRKEWNKIVALLPDKNRNASVSMTKKAREFRSEYQ